MSGEISENKKIVLYFSGGAMRGVFGAGVATYLEEVNIYDKLEAVYGSSSGALTGAYFLSKQTRLGSTIFYEDLTNNFISIRDFWIGAWQRIANRFLYKVSDYEMRDAMDIDYLFSVVARRKKLDIQSVINQEIPFYVKVFNLNKRETEYIEARNNNIVDILKASASTLPYVHNTVKIDGVEYTDAGTIDQIGLDCLIKKHPKNKIIIIFSQSAERKFKIILKNYLEGIVASLMYDWGFFNKFAYTTKKVSKELELIKNNPNILLVKMSGHEGIPTRTTDHTKLIKTYSLGMKLARPIMDFIKN